MEKKYFDKNIPHIFVVYIVSYDYESSHATSLGAFNTEDEAIKYCEEKQEELDNLKNISIHNVYDVENVNSEYSKLLYEFDEYIVKKNFDYATSSDDLSDDDYEKFLLIDENFLDWMINVKHISKEVAEATIKYNDNYDSGYDYYYDYEPIKLISTCSN